MAESIITQTTQDFVKGMERSGNFAAKQIIALIKELDTQDGEIISTDRNQQLIDGVSLGIAQVAVSGAFRQRVAKVINSVPKVRKETERSFIVKNGIIPNEVLGQLDVMESEIQDYLVVALGENMILNEVIAPVVGVLNAMVTNMMDVESAETLARNKVPSLFTQYAHTRVETSLQIYARSINSLLANAKGLEWWQYVGPTGPTALGNPIRSFCGERVEGVYLTSEVESWANENWEGKIPDTNQISIFNYLGGFNCRHDLIPTPANQVPKKWKTRAKNLGLA